MYPSNVAVRAPREPLSTDDSFSGRSRVHGLLGLRRRLPQWLLRALLCVLLAVLVMPLGGCNRTEPGSPEAVADAFADAYFHRADQEAAKAYTAFGASKMLDRELEDVKKVRAEGFVPGEVKLNVSVRRGERSEREHRVRFKYTLNYLDGNLTKYADIELTQVRGAWKVVRVGLAAESASPAPS